MQRDIHAASIRADSEETESKYSIEEMNIILSEAKVKLPRQVAHYANEMNISYEKVFVKAQKTRWGSCSSKGNINLNCLVMKVPLYVRKYVIVHELAHRKEMNHSERFWRVVAEEIPEYQKAVKWLKKNGDSLIGRLP
ncbi:MAG: M48 family metallopeptidase [Lachnospiraceae bacterium]|nr:M48 family metallopeptidase [Lachnospiraceae bacterium]